MSKLKKSELPLNHQFSDFSFTGKFAEKDGYVENTDAAYLGSFEQETKNSNKFYFGCVCQSSKNNLWYSYFEWGRTGLKSDYQFYEFSSKEEAVICYKKQIESKNIKRGILTQHPILGEILKPKPGKDLYMIRKMASINCNIPNICQITTKTTIKSKSSSFDPQTESLLRDLKTGTVNYTRSKFSSGMIPDLTSIEDARKLLGIATKSDKKELEELTRILYSKIPKSTIIGEKIELSQDNIKSWLDDLDVFENAYQTLESGTEEFSLKYLLKYLDNKSNQWYILDRLVKASTRNRHSYLKEINIEHIWEVTNIPDSFIKQQEKVAKEHKGDKFPLIFQPERSDLEVKSNTQLLFHGSRSINIGKIIETGFKLPKELSGVSINGSMFGGGSYHACDYKKSVGYCSIPNGYWSRGDGTIQGRKAFMFLNDVILGNPHIVSRSNAFNKPPVGCHSVIADTKGGLQNEEFIVYDTAMFYPRYLIEFAI